MPHERLSSARRNVHFRIALPALITVVLFVVAMTLVFFPHLERGFLERKKETALRLVESAHSMLQGFEDMVQAGTMDLPTAQATAAGILRNMRYGRQGKDYFWINDLEPRMIMHPYRPDLEGQDLSGFRDPNGVRIFQEMTRLAREQGGGVVEYLWQFKDDPDLLAPKASYVGVFEPWGWIVGTGVYYNDVREEMASLRGTLLWIAGAILGLVLLLAGYMVRVVGRSDAERMALNTALEEHRERYRSLVDNLTTGVALISREHRILAVNEQLRRWFPSMSEEQSPLCYKEFNALHLNQPCDPCPLEETFEDGLVHEKTAEHRVDSGDVRTFRVTTSPVLDADGKVSNVIEMFEDVTDRVRADEKLRQAESRYRNLFENTTEGIYQTTPDGRHLEANHSLALLYGYDSPEDLKIGLTNIREQLYLDPARRDEFVRLMETRGEVTGYETQIVRRDGQIIWISENARAVRDEQGEIVYYEGTVEDITERMRHEQAMAEQKAFFQELFESSPMAIAMLNAEGVILDVNHSFESMFGYKAEDITGSRNREVVVPEKYFGEAEAFRRTILKGNSVSKETERKTASGQLLPVDIVGSPIRLGEEVVGAYYTYQDITERKEFEKQLSHQAFHDSLTALPNRTLYMERLRHALERSRRRENYHFAVLMVDLDRFKRVNDTLGHFVGDQLLVGFSLRILSCIRTVDTVARLGGDEFALLLEEFESPREVIRVSNRIRDILQEPFTIEGNRVHTGASMGIVLDTRDYASAEDILRDADIAMYQAKEQGKSRLVFNKRMHQQAVAVGRMEAELRIALERGEFELYYQPIVALADQAVQGFEALVRWNHPRRGVVEPLDFIPLAEETGLIIPMGRWIIHEACRQMAEWVETGVAGEAMSMSVNLSAKQFMQPDLVDFVQATLVEVGLPPVRLKLEVTESVIMQDAPSTSAKLARLKNHGVKIMIDDFGTGYSSLSYLQQFPVDYLKIDRSFISGAGNVEEKMEIVKTIITLARNLGLGVVAEGVEKEEQLLRLQEAKCETAQGYMFSRPMRAEAATNLLAAGRAREEGS